MNRKIHAHMKVMTFMRCARNFPARFKWYPERVKSAWMPLSGSSWEAEFDDEMRKYAGNPTHSMAPLILEASDNLTMAMTILYALEVLHDGDEWTRQHALIVHVIGANEIEATWGVFEEILHRLPQVKILKDVSYSEHMVMVLVAHGRSIVYIISTSYIATVKHKFEKPHLCIAFNSGASQVSTRTWLPTLKLLVQDKIPTVFTSFNREEAEGEAALLRAAGAKLHPALGPCGNPWGSISLRPSEHKIYGFNSDSGWLAGGFR
ncbi:hypothetical protein DFH07DRAFT_900058 [Mycena maculata]|uniref:Mitochondrial splicing suppressor 51-like C-terminal domain-containing protein n=1 Tax=Mycena maculata TaxID=230809 RepID=A0AAD7H8S2_9AGAR|nr:hypothetical protein DFH07DRAFT_900058 [Mycena maculata]